MLQYKGYLGKVEFDEEAELFHGRVIGINDIVNFQGTTPKEIKQEFQNSIDDYLDFCEARGEKPDKPFSGKFVVRLTPELHRQINQVAEIQGVSLNALVTHWLQDQARSSIGVGIDIPSSSKQKQVNKKKTKTKRISRTSKK
jgi:predicted HicB family RNase H-like nuclease